MKYTRFSRAVIDQIRDNTDIVALAKELGLPLRRTSHETWSCKCIFHNDNNPSLTFFEDSNTFYCFGCSEKAEDSFELVQRVFNYSFFEAVKFLADRIDIDLEESGAIHFDWGTPKQNKVDITDLFMFAAIKSKDSLFAVREAYGASSVEYDLVYEKRENIFRSFDEAINDSSRLSLLENLGKLNRECDGLLGPESDTISLISEDS